MCLQKFPTQFADFPKSATGQLLSYLHVLAEIPPSWRFSKICYWTAIVLTEILPPVKSATGQLPKLPTCACRNSPSLQIFQNLPLDTYLHVLAEIPPSLQIL